MLVVKNPPASAGDGRDTGSITGSGRSPGAGHGNLLQYSCLENPMNRGTWWATVYGVAKSWTQLKRLNIHARTSPKTLFSVFPSTQKIGLEKHDRELVYYNLLFHWS